MTPTLIQSLLTGFSLGVLRRLIAIFLAVFLQYLDVCADLLLHHSTGLDEVIDLIHLFFLFSQLFLDLPLYGDRPRWIRILRILGCCPIKIPDS